MPSFREQLAHFNEALTFRCARPNDQEQLDRWTLLLETCRFNISHAGLSTAREKKLIRHIDKAAHQVRGLMKQAQRDAFEWEDRGAMHLSLWVLRRRIQLAGWRQKRSR